MSGKWDVQSLTDQLERKYTKTRKGRIEWQNEGTDIQKRLALLSKEISNRYTNPEALNYGGSGIVLKAQDSWLDNQPVAIKMPRPIPLEDEFLKQLLEKEISTLIKLRHPNIVRIREGRILRETSNLTAPFPYYVMDYIEGKDSVKYFSKSPAPLATLLSIVSQTVDAFAYMHGMDLVHFDIKPENILISEHNGTPVPIVADLGTTKKRDPDDKRHTLTASTHHFMHPDLETYLLKHQSDFDKNRVEASIPRNEIEPKFDIFSLGRTIIFWLGIDPLVDYDKLPILNYESDKGKYALKYLLLLGARMMDGVKLDDKIISKMRSVTGTFPIESIRKVVGLDTEVLKQITPNSMGEVEIAMKKLTNEYSLIDDIPELNQYYFRTLQVASDTPTPFSNRVRNIYDHRMFNRLSRISQLGLVADVYPTASQNRSEHSIGTFHFACHIVYGLYHDPINPLFRQVVSDKHIRSVLAASLLHDIGQYPMAHDFEELDPDYEPFKHQLATLAILGGASGSYELPRHLTNVADFTLLLHSGSASSAEGEEWDIECEDVVRILTARPQGLNPGSFIDRILHSIVDSAIDADKLDYLTRDSERLGLPYSRGIDLDRIMRTLTVTISNAAEENSLDAEVSIGIYEKGRVAAESISFARYAMFSQVYWHHTTRSMKAMMARALMRLRLRLRELAELDKGETETRFKNEFVDVAMSLGLSRETSGLSLNDRRTNIDGLIADDNKLADTDLRMLAFLRSWLMDLDLSESELISDILQRNLYKRLYVYSPADDDSRGWDAMLQWHILHQWEKDELYGQLENEIVERIGRGSGASDPAGTLLRESLRERVEKGRPVILIDVPRARKGDKTALLYVAEGQMLDRKSSLGVTGTVQKSAIWKYFGMEMHERAGHATVFCREEFVDLIQGYMNWSDFIGMFNSAKGDIGAKTGR